MMQFKSGIHSVYDNWEPGGILQNEMSYGKGNALLDELASRTINSLGKRGAGLEQIGVIEVNYSGKGHYSLPADAPGEWK
jgi:hypothetical protein